MPWPPDALATLERHGVRLTSEQVGLLDRYAGLISERGRVLNLVSASDCGRLYDRHLFDSLTAVPLVEWWGKRVLDLGSGAGLPGIPLAIALPTARFTLIDRTRKRVAFIVQAISALALTNVNALWSDAVHLAQQPAHAHEADILTVRAVAETRKALSLARPLLKPTGTVLLWQTLDQWKREPTPDGFDGEWRPVPSRDDIERGIRLCSSREGC
jgi:16S rRNA (guanine527-N7)-methyltransferase